MLRASRGRLAGLGGRVTQSAPTGATPAATSHSAPLQPQGTWDKVKAEMKKTLKVQLVLVPVGVALLLWLNPPLTAEQEHKMRKQYEKNSGWKS